MSHKAVIRAGKPTLDVLDWAIWVIYIEIMLPMSMSICMMSPYIRRARSMMRYEVWEVGARLKYESMLHVWAMVVRSFRRIFHGTPLTFSWNHPLGVHSLAMMVS